MRKIWNDLLNLFYPRLCLVCGTPLLEGEEFLCLSCLADLPYTYIKDINQNSLTRKENISSIFEHAYAYLIFKKNYSSRLLVHEFKFHGNKELAFYLGQLAATEVLRHHLFTEIEAFVPTPLYYKRKRQRGYNQAEWICKGMASVWKLPIETQLIFRNRYTPPQAKQHNREARQKNLKEAFSLINPTRYKGKHLLLVDDVITTGATCCTCGSCLQAIPDVHLSVFSISMAY